MIAHNWHELEFSLLGPCTRIATYGVGGKRFWLKVVSSAILSERHQTFFKSRFWIQILDFSEKSSIGYWINPVSHPGFLEDDTGFFRQILDFFGKYWIFLSDTGFFQDPGFIQYLDPDTGFKKGLPSARLTRLTKHFGVQRSGGRLE